MIDGRWIDGIQNNEYELSEYGLMEDGFLRNMNDGTWNINYWKMDW